MQPGTNDINISNVLNNSLNGPGNDNSFIIPQSATMEDQDELHNPSVSNNADFNQNGSAYGGTADAADGIDAGGQGGDGGATGTSDGGDGETYAYSGDAGASGGAAGGGDGGGAGATGGDGAGGSALGVGLGVGQVLVCEAGAEGLQIFGELCAPLAVGGEVLDARHVVIRKRAWRLLYHKPSRFSAGSAGNGSWPGRPGATWQWDGRTRGRLVRRGHTPRS